MNGHKLECYFTDEEGWQEFVKCFEELWQRCNFKDILLESVCGNLDVAKVIYGTFEQYAVDWIHEPISALDGLAPIQCMKSPNTIQRLKSMLMRMPRQ